jgi:uncharacterized protein (DUF983 family)
MSGKLLSIIRCRCPRCNKGSLFVNPNPYVLQDWDRMNISCLKCGQKFELEPGFYQGAMYVSYALAVAWSIGLLLVFWLIIGFNPLSFFLTYAITLVLLAPVIFRWARSLYLHFFIRQAK